MLLVHSRKLDTIVSLHMHGLIPTRRNEELVVRVYCHTNNTTLVAFEGAEQGARGQFPDAHGSIHTPRDEVPVVRDSSPSTPQRVSKCSPNPFDVNWVKRC